MPGMTFWFEFASTYSYLAAMRIGPLARDAGVEVRWRPFLLGPTFRAQGWNTSPFNIYAAKGRNMWRDVERQAAGLGLPPVVRPDPFPQNGLLAARTATFGEGAAWGPGFVRAVFTAEFAEGRDISDPAGLAALLDGLGQPGHEILARAGTDQSVKDRLRLVTDDAQAQGIFGAPSFVPDDGELFWGNDRLEEALAWAAAG
ncbi:2-hydroxychromene-2-carboxylate isomerase [Marimonas arenosa]|uniref:2-hydroxychromene-2-carboxylate isomerase n=1 Tax=Marimonas arenosa TaxID=1795305 RepID=A0AAE3WB79_9RHOB|nr:2-hydroxychromene-2-carboxylate isomerase [Marimonas arenosa]MDQ2089771.1 2-hydroxychromene-2-carboxylate isomerase [Marimonas arenosa]